MCSRGGWKGGTRAAGRQESSWIRESCWPESRSPPAGRRLLGDLGPVRPVSEPQFPQQQGQVRDSLDHELPGGVDFQDAGGW